MTPDELPADMEKRLALRLRVDPDFVSVQVDREDLRALLKAYQEQRRALERIAGAEIDGLDLARDSMVLTRAVKIARAALNQKGDEL
jgi:hypothetical protein